MSDLFKIGPVVNEVPPSRASDAGKYAALYAQVEQLETGQWLTVTVETVRQGQRILECAKLKNYRAKRRKLTVYLSKQ